MCEYNTQNEPPGILSVSFRHSRRESKESMASRFIKSLLPRRDVQGSATAEEDHIDSLPSQPQDPIDTEGKDALKDSAVEVGEEKIVPGTASSSSNEAWADSDPAIRDIPASVRRIVSLDDDPTLPTLTFRYFFLTFLFVIPGAFMSQLSHYRTTYIPFSVFFTQVASNYIGIWMGEGLPAWEIRIPFTRWGFNLNPCPWGVKEHVLVTISAASGATYNLAFAPVTIAELFFGHRVNAGVAIVFMWSVVVTGYSFAAISRQFLLYDPQYPWLVLLQSSYPIKPTN